MKLNKHFIKLRPDNLELHNHARFIKVHGKTNIYRDRLEKLRDRAETNEELNDDTVVPGSGPDTEPCTEVIENLYNVYTGVYNLDFDELPLNPELGWQVGKGRDKDGTGVDLLLSRTEKNDPVRGIHGSFVFHQATGMLLFTGMHESYLLYVDGEIWPEQSVALIKSKTQLKIGLQEYQFRYTIMRDQDAHRVFLTLQADYFQDSLGKAPPDTASSSIPSSTDIYLGEWSFRGTIGEGASVLVSPTVRSDGSVAAVKHVVRYNNTSKDTVMREIRNARSLGRISKDAQPPTKIVKLQEVIYERGKESFDFKCSEKVWLIYIPLARHTFELMIPRSHGWVHRDIKPANLGVVTINPPHAVILDLGCAVSLPKEEYLPSKPVIYGILGYLAPELEVGRYTYDVDIWSLGIVGHELFKGNHPWHEATSNVAFNPWLEHTTPKSQRLIVWHSKQLESLRGSGSSEIDILLASMMVIDARPLAESPKNLTDLRITAVAALAHEAFYDNDAASSTTSPKHTALNSDADKEN